MSAITFQFCGFDSTFGKIIEWGTEGDVGHVDLVLPDWHPRAGDLLGAQHETGLGGMPSGVQIRPANYGDTCGMTNRQRVSLPTTLETEKAAYEWALSMVGSPYDTAAIKGIAVNEDWSTHGSLICSGLGAGTLTQPSPSFIGHQFDKPWRIMTPMELKLICNAFAPIVKLG
jgi:hypothetical protein